MNALHSTTSGAVVTRLHDAAVARSTEKSGAVNGRGCVRGAGRQHKPSYMTVVDAPTGGSSAAYGEATGERASCSEAEFTAYVQERRASLYATAYHLTGDR